MRFPVLCQMARDILAFPINTVASESAFSTGGRVLNDFRSSLTPKMVEGLIYAQDWMRKTVKAISVEEDPEEMRQLDEALEKMKVDASSTAASATGTSSHPELDQQSNSRIQEDSEIFLFRDCNEACSNNVVFDKNAESCAGARRNAVCRRQELWSLEFEVWSLDWSNTVVDSSFITCQTFHFLYVLDSFYINQTVRF
ncbi:uncharacterized protein LOC141668447 isoform X2 [Apium graveolens]|uniref:uncharacterized protein LOC141668447 isoform X2 n=1 Tax=Apium graveolens TaxID=4045 RepID=UPI003D7964F1